MSPLIQQQQQQQQQQQEPQQHKPSEKKSSVADSDYKTQSSSSSSSAYIDPLDDEAALLQDADAHLDACEQLLALEERFIDLMQKGVQQYSRPLRHCTHVTPAQHHTLFQNIEKLLAISEYQLHQLISQDDATLLDMFTTIGKLYENKMRMSCEAFDVYLGGVRPAFAMLASLQRSHGFANFVSESRDDIAMDLATFLLLPIYYVCDIHERLCALKDKTRPLSDDHICLSTLLSGLEAYVNKSTALLNEYNGGQSKNPLKRLTLTLGRDEPEVALVQYRQSSHKWKVVQMVVLSDKVWLASRRTSISELLEDTAGVQAKLVDLKSVLNVDFSLPSECEFQVNYVREGEDGSGIHAVRLRVSSAQEKARWSRIFSSRLSKLSGDKTFTNSIVWGGQSKTSQNFLI